MRLKLTKPVQWVWRVWERLTSRSWPLPLSTWNWTPVSPPRLLPLAGVFGCLRHCPGFSGDCDWSSNYGGRRGTRAPAPPTQTTAGICLTVRQHPGSSAGSSLTLIMFGQHRAGAFYRLCPSRGFICPGTCPYMRRRSSGISDTKSEQHVDNLALLCLPTSVHSGASILLSMEFPM